MIGDKNISVSNARKILTSYNRQLKKEQIRKDGKGGKGVWKMTTSDIESLLKDFKITQGSIRHKFKVPSWKYEIKIKDIPTSAGKVKKSKPLTSNKKFVKKKMK